MYRVEWSRETVDQLVKMLEHADAALRIRIENALRRIDAELRVDPWNVGESRPNGTRIHFAAPVGVTFVVDRADQRVVVLFVWVFREKHGERPT